MHLKKIQADYAWNITFGDPNIKIAIIDSKYDITHPDIASEIVPHYDPYDLNPHSCIAEQSVWNDHGTAVASFASAETTAVGGIAKGQLASVGFNTKMIGYITDTRQINLAKALHASNVMGASVIVSCAGASLKCDPLPNSGEALIVKEILDNGTVIVMPAGNGLGATHCMDALGNYHAFYPFHPSYDNRIIIVTSTDTIDKHQHFHPGTSDDVTHSHFADVDICAPGYILMGAKVTECKPDTTTNFWPYYGSFTGTSFASPIVAGVCALIKSINPDFTPAEIQYFIKSTADPVTDEHNYSGLLGAGRINAFKAVEMTYNCNPIVVSSNEIWNDGKVIVCGLEIKNNATLTVTSEIKLSKRSTIIIEPGSKLIVDGGKLNSLDNNPWQGIQVWGNKTAHQFPDANGNYQQGYLKLINGATIENAIVAVDLWKPNDYSSTGGMVYATNAIFRNNAKSIHALHYRNFHPYNPQQEVDYHSNFKNCSFEIDVNYPGPDTFYKHINIAFVNGINFQGCDFSLDKTAPHISTWNHAIAGYNARFSLIPICNSQQQPCPENDYDKCTFTGFYSAISAVNDGTSTVTFSVNRANFINNAYGIKARGMNNAGVLFSDFKIGHWDCGVGIFSDKGTGFAFEENKFSKYVGGPISNYFGIVINNSEAANEVYKNSFDSLSYANFSDGKNWFRDRRHIGLAYYCNQNSNNYADFYVNDFNDDKHSGIQSLQGSDTYVVGNTFTKDCATWHFYNGGEHMVDYNFNKNIINEIPENDKIYYVAKVGRNVSNNCPSHYGGNSETEIILTTQQKLVAQQEYYANRTDYSNVKALYDNYIDGGNTNAKLNEIQYAQPSDMWTLRGHLLGDSPHLSFEVLKKAADKTNVFTESALFDILAANPDELKKDTLISYLENKENPLPKYMIDILLQLAKGTTYKTILQQQLADYTHKYTRAAHDIIRSNLNDTVTDYEELRNWLDNLGGITSDRQIITTYVSEGNFTNALTLANMLPQLYNLEGNELTEHNLYIEMLNLQQLLYQQGRNTFQLSNAEKAGIEFIAGNSKGVAGSQAKSIMEAVYNQNYPDCPEVGSSAGYKRSNIINPNALGSAVGLNISVKPNPARHWAAFDYTLPSNETKANITITNATGIIVEILEINGKQGQKLWDTRNIKPGVYFYTIKAAGVSQSGKIIISK